MRDRQTGKEAVIAPSTAADTERNQSNPVLAGGKSPAPLLTLHVRGAADS